MNQTTEVRQLPHDLEAERAVLGACLLDGAAITMAANILTVDDYYDGRHQRIYRAILELHGRGEGIDNITLSAELERRGHLTNIGGRATLAELVVEVPSAANVQHHCAIIRDCAVRRDQIRQAREDLERAYQGNGVPTVELVRPVEPLGSTWPELDGAAYYGLVGEAIRLIEPSTEADSVALLASLLAEVGTMLGRGPHLVLDGAYHPLLFWPVLVGQSSKSRKGSAAKRMEVLLRQADPLWTRGECRGTLSSGEGLVYAIRDEQYREEPIKEKGRPTGETVTIRVDAGVADKRLFLVQAEFGAVLRIMGRDGNSLSGVLRDAWDGVDLAPMTKSNRVKATAPHVGIVGHVTKDELLRNLTDTEACNGFGNRFCWLAVRRSKELPFPSAPNPTELHRIALALGEAIRRARSMGKLGMADSAHDAWRAVYHNLSADRPGLVGALTARGEGQVMRIAALYAVLDGLTAINRDHLAAALSLWEYAEASARMIFGDATGDAIADTILRAVRTAGDLSDSQVSDLFGRHVSAARLDRAKTMLAAVGLIHRDEIRTGGRPRMAWKPGAKKAKEAK